MAHAFISYVRENVDDVERLSSFLRSFGVDVWLDRDRLRPGCRWKSSLQNAIETGSFFIACFSKEYISKSRSYMNEEITLAIEQLRLRPFNCRWFIPVKVSSCDVPNFPIGLGQTLHDLHWVDLTENWMLGALKIIETIQPEYFVSIQNTERARILIAGCRRHIDNKMAYYIKFNTLMIQELVDRWYSLVSPPWSVEFSEHVIQLFDRCVLHDKTITERMCDSKNQGRIIIVTAAPNFRTKELYDSFQTTTHSCRGYSDFILFQRAGIREWPEWQNRDLVHWIFRQDGREGPFDIDLLYVPSIELATNCRALELHLKAEERGKLGPLQDIYPGSLLGAEEADSLFTKIFQEDMQAKVSYSV